MAKKELWAVLYLHDWGDDGQIYPEIHALYETMHEASTAVLKMKSPNKYWVRRARLHSSGDPAATHLEK